MEAEYIALSDGGSKIKLSRNVLKDMEIEQRTTKVCQDHTRSSEWAEEGPWKYM